MSPPEPKRVEPLGRVEKARLVVEAGEDLMAERPVALDVREVSSFADTFVLLSGRSDRQVRAIADAISRALEARGEPILGREGFEAGRWVLMDCNDVIVHVFGPGVREHYDLERLWSDAPEIEMDPPSGFEAARGEPS
ncbi:MAG: ribosome silencing factor [Myxococcota bacterium]